MVLLLLWSEANFAVRHPREALLMASEEGFEEHHSVDWARPETRAP